MAFPEDLLDITVELALGADLAADPATWVWTDITDYCKPYLRITGVGRDDEQSAATPAQLSLTVDNSDGRFTRRNPVGAWYGQIGKHTPIRATVADDAIPAPSRRFQGFITELPPRWEPGYTDMWVPITANGVLRRLAQQDLVDSAAKRFVLGTDSLRAYWPLEDGRDADQRAASAVPGQPPMLVNVDVGGGDATGASWASHSDLPGSEPVAGFAPTARAHGHVYSANARASWSVAFWGRGDLADDATDGTWTSMQVLPVGTDLRYMIAATNTAVTCRVIDNSDGSTVRTLTSAAEMGALALIGQWHSIALLIHDVSSSIVRVSLMVDGVSGDSFTFSGRQAGRPNKVIAPDVFDEGITGMGLGHIAVWDAADYSMPAGYHAAGMGWARETAGDRVRRICAEERVPATVLEAPAIETAPASSRMGPQDPASVAALLQECEIADGGLLYEDPQTGGIGYIARSWLYQQTESGSSPDMALDIDAGDITADLESDDGDQFAVNDMTVSRPGGSSARFQDIRSGDLPDPRSVTINVAYDGALLQQASWRTHLGNVDEYRFPVVPLDFKDRPELIPQWVQAGIGSRVVIEHPPPDFPPAPLNLIIVGYVETVDGVEWNAELHCVPASPYEVAQLPGELTVVGEDFEDDDMNVVITGGGALPWFRSDADAHHGRWSFQSGAISQGSTSDAIVTVPAGCTRARFWYRTSSEAGLDELRVIVGGVTRLTASGQSAWTLSEYIDVTPGGTITFRYATSIATVRFYNRVNIDDLQFEGGDAAAGGAERGRLDTAGSVLAAAVGPDDTELTVTTVQGPPWIQVARGLVLPGAAGSYASTPDTGTVRITGAAASDPAASDPAVAPSVDAPGPGLLVCSWTSYDHNTDPYALPAGMDEVVQMTGDNWSVTATAVGAEPVAAGATGTRSASIGATDAWSAASVVIPGAAVAVEDAQWSYFNYIDWVGPGDGPSVTTAAAEPGWWVVAIASCDLDASNLLPGRLTGDGWALITASPTGQSARTVVWAREVTEAGPVTVTYEPAGSDDFLTVLLVSGTDINPGLNATGVLRVRAEVSRDSWTPTADETIAAKYRDATDDRSWRLDLLTTGALRLQWTSDGTTGTISSRTSSAAITSERPRLAIGVTYDPATGTAAFATAESMDGTWTALGTAQVGSPGSIYVSEADLEVGARDSGTQAPWSGTIHALEVTDDAMLLADAVFDDLPTGTTQFVDQVGLTWTVHGDAAIGSADPFDIRAGGEVMRVEGITGADSPQTFTVTRSVNGVVKPHPVGADVRLAYPMILALGD